MQRGEFFGLLGPNGAGKTTLFKILATLVLPDEGSITVEGCDVVANAAGVRRVLAPVIADERSLHWRLSAYENLRLFAVLQGVGPAVLRHRVMQLLEAVGLADEGSKMVGTFSSGMRQRLLIARALHCDPESAAAGRAHAESRPASPRVISARSCAMKSPAARDARSSSPRTIPKKHCSYAIGWRF